MASADVNDYALKEAAFLINMLLAKRPDVRDAMIKSGSRMCIIGVHEFTTDLPEWKWMAAESEDNKQAEGVTAKTFGTRELVAWEDQKRMPTARAAKKTC